MAARTITTAALPETPVKCAADSKRASATNTKKFQEYLRNFIIKKDGPENAVLEKTNTRIGDASKRIAGGSYHIPDEEYYNFLKIYHEEIVARGAAEYLTEKQLTRGGPILVDVDFRYEQSSERQYTKDHIVDMVCLYLEELQKIFQFDDSTIVPIFVLEKPGIVELKKGESVVTKDGIHMIIGLQADRVVQQILRKRIVDKIGGIWADINITNTWDNAFDDAVTKGNSNWQLVGSKKPTSDAYPLSYVFHVSCDPQDKELVMPEVPIDLYMKNSTNFAKLSARYRDHPVFFMKPEFIDEYNKLAPMLGGGNSPLKTSASSSSMVNIVMPSSYSGVADDEEEAAVHGRPNNERVRSIRNKEELDEVVAAFLASLSPAEFDLREAYEYTMALPKTYYATGSFDKWIRVGWALRNISTQLFLVWVAFSAKADNFSYSNIRTDLWDRWSSFPARVENGLTKRSIMYWVKQENAETYKTILSGSVESMIDATLDSALIQNSGDDKRIRGSGDYDIAVVLFHLFREEYKCVSVKANMWYRFHNHRWKEIDSGTTLRKAISNELRDMYTAKLGKLMRQLGQIKQAAALAEGGGDEDQEGGPVDRMRAIKKRIQIVSDIVQRLGKTADKKNIMTEAKELFFDPIFLEKLDQNPYLMCFSNGVVDFKEKCFRRGLPEDYMSKCTNIQYRPVDPQKDAKVIDEINDFMGKLFPNPELYRYMWDHLASTLIGNNMNQTFNMYTGIGQNGKSVLVELMSRVLGEYKADVPLSLLTQQRTRIGGLAPELVALKGARYAVMQEPSKGDRINDGIMKQVTGGDPIQARAPYMPEMVTFIPQFKLVVCLNVFMEIASQDHGTRRRIRVVDFESLFTENPVQGDKDKPYQFKLDKTIKEKFDYWKEVFAAMLVEISYKNEGNVTDCAKVMASSNSYLNKQDFIGEFITERIEPAEHGCITKAELTHWFKEWYSNNMNGRMPAIREVTEAIEKKFGKMQSGVWTGIRFIPMAAVSIGGGGSANFDDGSTIHTSSTHRAEESGGGGPVDDICNIEEL